MKKTGFDAIAQALNQVNVPFIIVGGIAVIHHGYGRATQDVDIVIRLEKDVIFRTFQALESLGYRPIVPIKAEQFADAATRDQWYREKGMRVLKFWSEQYRETPLDLFITEPFDFQHEYAIAEIRESTTDQKIKIVSLNTLLAMKKTAGRPQDLADIDELNLLHGKPSSYDRKA